MKPTARTWTTAAVAVTLAAVAPVVASPVPAVGSALVFGWLIARQLIAVRQFQTAVDATTVSVTPAVSSVRVGTGIPVTLFVERPPTAAQTALTVSLSLPPAARPVDVADRQITLAAGETQATTTAVLSIPTAGRMQIPEPTWDLADTHSLFTESFDRGPTPTVTVTSSTLENLHVGRGGSELSAFGQHPTDKTGEGITPTELRKYIIGDPADRIDWKATARLSEPYVREFEAETDREVTVILDHRARMGASSPNSTAATGSSTSASESPLAYVREVALSIVDNAKSTGEPLGLITVGDEGLTEIIPAARQQVGYVRITEQLLRVAPTPAGPPGSSVDLTHPATARRLAQQLADDQSSFGTILRQFTETTPSYTERIETDPLYGAVDYLRSTSQASQLVVILTTDTDRPQLRETVRAAAKNDSSVLVFLTPQVLFDAGELGDLEAAYRRYREFEQFRTDLERFDAVSAYEVGPGDRLTTLLSNRADRAGRQSTPGGTQ